MRRYPSPERQQAEPQPWLRAYDSFADGLPLALWQLSESTSLLNDSAESCANDG